MFDLIMCLCICVCVFVCLFVCLCVQAVRRAMSEIVPEEPADDSPDKICTLRLRYPDGQVGQRRFLACHTLRVI